MDKQNGTSLKNLLDVDLEAIANEGKRLNRKRQKILIVTLVVTVTMVSIIGTLAYLQNKNEQKYEDAITALQNKEYEIATTLFRELDKYKDSAEQLHTLETLESLYQEAITNQQNGEYEIAIDLFRNLGDYRNSQEELKHTSVAVEVLDPAICEAVMETVEELNIGVAISPPATYSLTENIITFNSILSDNSIDFQNITYDDYDKWINICQQLKATTSAIENWFEEYRGHSIECQFVLADSSKKLLFSAKSGEETYVFKSESAFKKDLEKDKETAQKEEKYRLAKEHEEAMHYTYAKILFGELGDYRDAEEHYNNMLEILEPYNGTYNITTFTGVKYKMEIKDGEGTLKLDLVDTIWSIEILGYDFGGTSDNVSIVFTTNGYADDKSTPIERNWYYGNNMDVYSIHIDAKNKVMIFACEGNMFTTYNGSGTKK